MCIITLQHSRSMRNMYSMCYRHKKPDFQGTAVANQSSEQFLRLALPLGIPELQL